MKPAMPSPAAAKSNGGYLFLPKRLARGAFLKWLRRVHAWCGLWGAVLGLLFGLTGILLNHRSVLPIPAAQWSKTSAELRLPEPAPADAEALGRWLQTTLELRHPPQRVRIEPAKPLPWGDGKLMQPARWQLGFSAPGRSVEAEYFVGNASVNVTRRNGNGFALLNSLHTGAAGGIGWILLADSIAGSFIVLALTGTLLWTRLHGSRLLAAGLALGSLGSAVWLAVASL